MAAASFLPAPEQQQKQSLKLRRWPSQDELRPILLRRMKEDVEDLPAKEEVVVRVQLTHQQRRFYKAIFAKQARPPSLGTLPHPTRHLSPSALMRHLFAVSSL